MMWTTVRELLEALMFNLAFGGCSWLLKSSGHSNPSMSHGQLGLLWFATSIAWLLYWRCYSTSQEKRTVIMVRIVVIRVNSTLQYKYGLVQNCHETLQVLTVVATSSHTSTYVFLTLVVGQPAIIQSCVITLLLRSVASVDQLHSPQRSVVVVYCNYGAFFLTGTVCTVTHSSISPSYVTTWSRKYSVTGAIGPYGYI